MIIVNTHEAKTHLSRLLVEMETHHQKIRICRNGKAIADIVPIKETQNPLRQNKALMGIKMTYDPTLPLDEDEWGEDIK